MQGCFKLDKLVKNKQNKKHITILVFTTLEIHNMIHLCQRTTLY